MSSSPQVLGHMREKLAALDSYLAMTECLHQQKHLDRVTTECAYWHSGYRQALHDLLGHFDDVNQSKPTSTETLEVKSELALSSAAVRT